MGVIVALAARLAGPRRRGPVAVELEPMVQAAGATSVGMGMTISPLLRSG